MTTVSKSVESLVVRALVAAIRGYQILLSPVFTMLGAQCRFHPSCSAYAIVVIQKCGPWRGTGRAIRRLLRCQPWHPGGFDPP